MKIIDSNTIGLSRELSELDTFVLDFCSILEKHVPYVLVSGYVAILFGRSRGTEDVDLFIEKIPFEKFQQLYRELQEKDFWALNANDEEELFSMLTDSLAIRFAVKGNVIPNMEIKFIKDRLDQLSLERKIKVITSAGILWVSSIEMQVAYKRFILQSEKDLEDAQHLKKLFNIPEENINKYKALFQRYGRI